MVNGQTSGVSRSNSQGNGWLPFVIETLASFELQVVIAIDFKTVVTDSKCMCIALVWISGGQDTHNGSVCIFIDVEITEGDSCGSIITTDDGHSDLLINTGSVAIRHGHGVGLG